MRELLKKIGSVVFALAIAGSLGFGAYEAYSGRAAACAEPPAFCDIAEDCKEYCFLEHGSTQFDCDPNLSCCIC